MKVLAVLFALVMAASAMPYIEPGLKYYESMKYYGEPEEFITHVDKPVAKFPAGGYRLVTAGQYDLPYFFQNGDSYKTEYYDKISGFTNTDFNWHGVPSHYYNYMGYYI